MERTGHRIGRVVFATRASNAGDVSVFNERMRSRFDAVVLPALESALDSIDQAAGVIRLDRLEIDLGSLDDDLENLGEKLRAAVLAALPDRSLPAPAATVHPTEEELILFLQTGVLEWPEPGQTLAVFTQDVMRRSDADFAALTTRLRILLLRESTARRLVWQMPAAFVLRVLRVLAKTHEIPLPEADAGHGSDAFLSGPQAEIAHGLLQTLVRGQTGASSAADVQASFAALRRTAGEPKPPPASDLQTSSYAPRGAGPLEGGRVVAPQHEIELPGSESGDADSRTDPRPDKQPVFGAGAVLLHPFLDAFYAQLGLVDATGRFVSRRSQIRAVLLTHHLATGAMQAPEPETTVFKLLCGLSLNHPIPRETPIGAAELDEANSLLHSVIRHWSRLGETSPDGLRTGFLTRPGLLQSTDDGWLLTVEKHSIDVLLDYLPWPLSRVKTRCMSDLLAVGWR